MQTSRRASGYDLFKLIVAIVLLILYLILRKGTTLQTSISTTLVSPANMRLAPTQPTVAPVSPTSPALTATASEAASSQSHLQVGRRATILRGLNVRSSPGIRDNWLLTNIPGTRVEVIGGPECIPYWTGAYVWWQIKLPDGRVGWSAEHPLRGIYYFMEPRS